MTNAVYEFRAKICENCSRRYRPSGGKQKRCTNCRNSNLNFRRQRHLLRKFGITSDEYEQRLVDQSGVCAICKLPERRLGYRGTPSKLVLDHNHRTNQLRGLICHGCNTAIGHLHDDPELVDTVANYLRHWGEK